MMDPGTVWLEECQQLRNKLQSVRVENSKLFTINNNLQKEIDNVTSQWNAARSENAALLMKVRECVPKLEANVVQYRNEARDKEEQIRKTHSLLQIKEKEVADNKMRESALISQLQSVEKEFDRDRKHSLILLQERDDEIEEKSLRLQDMEQKLEDTMHQHEIEADLLNKTKGERDEVCARNAQLQSHINRLNEDLSEIENRSLTTKAHIDRIKQDNTLLREQLSNNTRLAEEYRDLTDEIDDLKFKNAELKDQALLKQDAMQKLENLLCKSCLAANGDGSLENNFQNSGKRSGRDDAGDKCLHLERISELDQRLSESEARVVAMERSSAQQSVTSKTQENKYLEQKDILSKQVAEQAETLAELGAERDRSKKTISALESKLKKLSNENKGWLKDLEQAKKLHEALEKEVATEKESNQRLREEHLAEFEAFSEQIDSHKEEKSQLKRALTKTEEELRVKDTLLGNIEQEITLQQQEYDSSLSALKSKISNNDKILEQKDESHSMCIKDLHSNVSQLTTQNQQLVNENQAKHSQIGSLQNALQAKIASVEQLEADLQRERITCSSYKGQVEKHMAKVTELQNIVAGVRTELNDARQQLASAKAEYNRNCDQFKQELQLLNDERSKLLLKQQETHRLKSEADILRAELEAMQQKLQEKETESRREKQRLAQKTSALQQDLQAKTAEYDSSQEKLTLLQEKYNQMKKQLSAQVNISEKLKTELSNLSFLYDDSTKLLQTKVKALEASEVERERGKKEIQLLQGDLHSRDEQVQLLEESLAARQKDLAQRVAQLAQLDMTVREMCSADKKRHGELEEVVRAQRTDLQRAQEELSDQACALNDVEARFRSKSDLLKISEKQLFDAKNDVSKMATELANLQRTRREEKEKFMKETSRLENDVSQAKQLVIETSRNAAGEKILRSAILNLEKKNQDLSDENRLLGEKSRKEVAKYRADLHALHQHKQALEAAIESLKRRNEDASAEYKNEEAGRLVQLNGAYEAMTTLQSELKTTRNIVDTARETIRVKDTQISYLENQLSSFTSGMTSQHDNNVSIGTTSADIEAVNLAAVLPTDNITNNDNVLSIQLKDQLDDVETEIDAQSYQKGLQRVKSKVTSDACLTKLRNRLEDNKRRQQELAEVLNDYDNPAKS